MLAVIFTNLEGLGHFEIDEGEGGDGFVAQFEAGVKEMGMDAGVIDLFARGLGRHSRPEEQAWPMIFLNSDAASYIAGENLNTDGGTISGITTGTIVIDFDPAAALENM